MLLHPVADPVRDELHGPLEALLEETESLLTQILDGQVRAEEEEKHDPLPRESLCVEEFRQKVGELLIVNCSTPKLQWR